jgi:hypothetical protein
MTKVVHFRRGAAGWLFEVLFYLFNLVMAIAIVSLLARSGDIVAAAESELARGLAGFGAATKLVILLFVWMAGDLILGLLTVISRSRRGSIED